MMNSYLAERGDAEIRSNTDLVAKSSFHEDPQFPDRKRARERQDDARELDMSERMLRRFAVQQIVLQCMTTMGLDALVYPTSNLPPPKLGAPGGARAERPRQLVEHARPRGVPRNDGSGGIHDRGLRPCPRSRRADRRRRRPGRRRRGSDGRGHARRRTDARARCRSASTSSARPFDEPTLFLIASAYEAATKHRRPPPDFGPVPGEP